MPTLSPAASPDVPAVGIGWRHPHYAALLEQQPVLDFIEVHSENFFADGGAALAVLREGRSLYPVSLHGVGLSLGSACGVDPWHLEHLARLVERIEPVRVSDHLCFARVRQATPVRGGGIHAADLLPLPLTRAALDTLCANIDQVQERLRRPIAVENLSAYVRWREAEMSEPEFLCTLSRRTGCHLLIDINNLYVNVLNDWRLDQNPVSAAQHNWQTASRAWLDAIDARYVEEIHLAGHCDTGALLIDDHGSRVSAAVWHLYQYAIARFGAKPTLIEWDTDVPALDVLLDEAQKARSLSAAALHTEHLATQAIA